MNLPETPFFSVIVCSINALRLTQISECYETLLADFPHEIIGIRNARSLAEGYNRALQRARGDIVIFSHDDILILDADFARKISARIREFDLLGFAGASRVVADKWWSAGFPWLSGVVGAVHEEKLYLNIWNPEPWPVVDNIQCIDGLCMIARREVAEEIGFDEVTFDDFHLYDLDFSFSAYRAGKKLGVCCDIPIIHASTGSYDQKHAYYGQRFIEKHRDAIPTDVPIPEPENAVGDGGIFAGLPDHLTLCATWQEESIRSKFAAYRQQCEKALQTQAT
ncbi:MAG: glycosyltransferase family protein [Zoogloeaceae bacterium]|jgi:glycosyltransferase involved in cell wall biosynthesis|nr:glycosyltransferase family protein [Zoogloeaceae bacterium]